MMKVVKIGVVVSLLVLENIGLWYVAGWYSQYSAKQKVVESKVGQAEVCAMLTISEELSSVLQKMNKYHPSISIDTLNRIDLNYGSESSKGFAVGAGIGLIFDKDYKLTNKNCGHTWEPVSPVFKDIPFLFE